MTRVGRACVRQRIGDRASFYAFRMTKAPPGGQKHSACSGAVRCERAPRRLPAWCQAVCGAGRTARLRPLAPYQASSSVTVWRWRLRMMSMIGP